MKYDLMDIRTALESFPARNEGETAFPDSYKVQEAVEAAGRNRRIAVDRERRMADEAAERRHRMAHPEDFVDLSELVAELANKKGMA